MASLNVFDSNAFGMMSLTAAINKMPYAPKMLGAMGIFREIPIRTTVAWVEDQEGKLALIMTAPRGTMDDVHSTRIRRARPFKVPHVPYFQTVLADDVQNLRAFGDETELEAVASHVNDQLADMRADHETTQEFHRVGALKGIILDADNSTVLYNLYTEFGTSQQTANFTGTQDSVASTVTSVIRLIATALGNENFGQVVALCGNTYFDAVTTHASVRTDYERWMAGDFLRNLHLGPQWYSQSMNGFMYHNVFFVNYRGTIGDVVFIPDAEAYYFPTGVANMFQEILAPADTMETVNTRGKRFYAFKELMAFNKGCRLHTQSNTLAINTRPRAVIKSTYAAS